MGARGQEKQNPLESGGGGVGEAHSFDPRGLAMREA